VLRVNNPKTVAFLHYIKKEKYVKKDGDIFFDISQQKLDKLLEEYEKSNFKRYIKIYEKIKYIMRPVSQKTTFATDK
jgi:hypothetical protein